MMTNFEIDRKVKEAMGSLDGMKPAEVNERIWVGILDRIEDERRLQGLKKIIPMRTVWLAAACFGLVVFLDVSFLLGKRRNNADTASVHGRRAAAAIADVYLRSE